MLSEPVIWGILISLTFWAVFLSVILFQHEFKVIDLKYAPPRVPPALEADLKRLRSDLDRVEGKVDKLVAVLSSMEDNSYQRRSAAARALCPEAFDDDEGG